MKKIIKRKSYQNKIEPHIENGLIKVFVGQRRVGKSYILFQTIEYLKSKYKKSNIIYINKEDFEFDDIKTFSDLIKYVESHSSETEKNFLFIDEIQDIADFEKALRHFQTKDIYDMYCTGSNAKLLSGELATYLAGRYIKIHIHSLSYLEYLDFHNLKDDDDSLLSYLKYGGMPHLINIRNDENVYFEYLQNIFDSIVLRDVVERYKIRNIQFLNDLINFISDNVGSLLTAKNISDYLKSQKINIQPKTILEYLGYLENVFLINRVKRMDVIGKKIFEISDKFYFEDIGIRNITTQYTLKDIAKILENIVFNHLRINDYNVFVGKLENREIDFAAQKNNDRVYIQVAYLIADENTHNREFGNLLKISDNHRKIVVTMDDVNANSYKGIEHINIRKFLTDFE
jgi:predicted AAA+ superfamily ATPase